MPEQHLLSLLIFLPILGGLLLLCFRARQLQLVRWSTGLAVLVSGAVFLLSLYLYGNFASAQEGFQFVQRLPWIPQFNIWYHLGVDGFSLPLILLTTFVMLLVTIASWQIQAIHHYLAACLLLEGLMIGVFASLDAALFYLFWEAMLIPMFLIIGIWGGPRRVYATIKFFLFTLLGSVFMLLALLYLYLQSGSFAIPDFHRLALDLQVQKWLFLAFLCAFAVKVPMWPVHTWLPDAHVEAPTGGSMILAAILLKMGGYGFLRFSLPITPDASLHFSMLMIVLSLIAVVYIGFVALVQADLKKLVAYSSVSHMGFVTLGLFVGFLAYANSGSLQGAALAMQGAMIQMISHGFISAALFFCVGVLYQRMHSREINAYGGVASVMPRFAALLMLFAMANSGLPGTSGFVGEFLVILGSFQASLWIAFFAALILVLGAAYTLWMYRRVIFGPVRNEQVAALPDLGLREFLVLLLLAVPVLLFGIWPAPLLQLLEVPTSGLLEHVLQGKV